MRRESSHFLDLMLQSLRQNVRMHNANGINSPSSRRSLSSGMSYTSTLNARSQTTAKEYRKKCYKKDVLKMSAKLHTSVINGLKVMYTMPPVSREDDAIDLHVKTSNCVVRRRL